MHRRFISLILAAALATAGISATPVQARDRNDDAKLLTGLAALAIVGAAIAHSNNNNNNNRRHHVDTYRGDHRGHDTHRGHNRRHDNFRGHGGKHNEHVGRSRGNHGFGRSQFHQLPASCRVHRGGRSGYSGRCLSRNYSGYNALPHRCAVRVGGRHGTVYRDGCLSRYGY